MSTYVKDALVVSKSNVKDALASIVVDPLVFQADDAEQRTFLQLHKDILSMSPQEIAYLKYMTIKGIYMAFPKFIRIIIVMVFVILFIVLVPISCLCLYKVIQTKVIEVASVTVLLLLTFGVWIWIRDL